MESPLVTTFGKRVSCPSSQTLLSFAGCRRLDDYSEDIEAHLVQCDFCSAELQLLTQHRSDTEEYAFVEMPADLRRLAEGLLHTDRETFKGFMHYR